MKGTCGLEQAEHLKKLKASGIRRFFYFSQRISNVIDLSLGEPDFTVLHKVFPELKEALAEECKCIVIRVTVLLACGVLIFHYWEKTVLNPLRVL